MENGHGGIADDDQQAARQEQSKKHHFRAPDNHPAIPAK
jgi:hypothetical protein